MAKTKLAVFLAGAICLANGVVAATNTRSLADAKSKTGSKAKANPAVDKETESKALNLVQSHLPELKEVLKRLRANNPREYDRAIRDLVKSARKLELAKNRDERLFDLEVELLKTQTHVNLLTAKLKVRDSKQDRQRLRESLERLQDAQIARAEYDVVMYQERLDRAKKLLDAARKRLDGKKDRGTEIDKTYAGLLRKAGREPNKSSTK